MPQTTLGSCDNCRGSDLALHPATKRCGRALVSCAGCGMVASAQPPPRDPPGRWLDGRMDPHRAAAVMRLLPRGRILEIGCSGGWCLGGLDPSRYEAVRLETRAEGADCETPPRAGAGMAALEAESFDLVALFGSLERAPSPRALLMETVRVLKSGGHVLIETPSLTSLTARLMGARWAPLADPWTSHIFHPPSLQRLVVTCGLTPTSVRTALPLGWPRPGSILFTARKSSETLRVPNLQGLALAPGEPAPLGAAH